MLGDNQQPSSFTLRFPFKLAKGQLIVGLEETDAPVFTIGEVPFTLKDEGAYYVLKGVGFPTEEAARELIPQLEAGLVWLLIHKRIAFEASTDVEEVTYAKDPDAAAKNLRVKGPVDGLANANRPIVYPTDKNIRIARLGQPSVFVTTPAEEVGQFIVEGVSELGNSDLLKNPQYRTAVDLYGAYFGEASDNARFLTLVMALEALATTRKRREPILYMVKNWQEEAKALPEKYEKDPEKQRYLETQIASLEGQLSNLMEESITSRIKKLVHETLDPDNDISESEPVKKVRDIYGVRSDLVHDGHVPSEKLRPALRDAQEIVHAVLVAIFQGNSSNS